MPTAARQALAKDVLASGRIYWSPKGPIPVEDELVKDFVTSFHQMSRDGYVIPVCVEHQDYAKPCKPDSPILTHPKTVGSISDLTISEDGTFSFAWIPKPGVIGQRRLPNLVSPEFTKSGLVGKNGTKYGPSVLHMALTDTPVNAGQGGQWKIIDVPGKPVHRMSLEGSWSLQPIGKTTRMMADEHTADDEPDMSESGSVIEEPELDSETLELGEDAAKQAEDGQNPPSWVTDEAKWDNAKEAASESKSQDDPLYWGLVTHIYKNDGGEVHRMAVDDDTLDTEDDAEFPDDSEDQPPVVDEPLQPAEPEALQGIDGGQQEDVAMVRAVLEGLARMSPPIVLPEDTDKENFWERAATALIALEAQRSHQEQEDAAEEMEEKQNQPQMLPGNDYEEEPGTFASGVGVQQMSATKTPVKTPLKKPTQQPSQQTVRMSMAEVMLQDNQKASIGSRLTRLVRTGRATPDEETKWRPLVDAYRMSWAPDGKSIAKTDVEKWIEAREAIPPGAFWPGEQRMGVDAEELSHQDGFYEMTDAQKKDLEAVNGPTVM